jgi:lipopolysaccharide transport system permease protein
MMSGTSTQRIPEVPADRAEAEQDGRLSHIGGHRRSGHINWGLIWTLIRTDFKTRYHGALTGFLWALLKPLAMFAVLMAVFSFLFRDPTYKLNLIIGLFLWDFFAEGTRAGLTSLHAKGFLLSKTKCHPAILIVTSVSNAIITLAVFCAVIIAFLVLSGRAPSITRFAIFLYYCSALLVIVVGFSLGSSGLFLRYRDLNQFWDVATQAGFFIAPIVYPIGTIPERFHFYLYLWPPTPIIEFSRDVLVRGIVPTRTAHVYLAIDAAAILLLGVVMFRWLTPRAAEFV